MGTKKGAKLSEDHKKKISENNAKYWLGKKIPQEMIDKIKISRRGYVVSKKTKDKISNTMKGMKGNTLGKKHTRETKLKMSKARSGEKHWNWQGGKSLEPYSVDWKETLRRSIRERDNYVCKICGLPQGDIAHDIHHIDYNKKNCDPDNLITLCHSCHTKTNNKREYWTNYFNELQKQWKK